MMIDKCSWNDKSPRYIDANAFEQSLDYMAMAGEIWNPILEAIKQFCKEKVRSEPTIDFKVNDKPNWISTAYRLPQEFDDVLVVVDGVVREANYHDNAFSGSNFWRTSAQIKWWMLLPELPKEVQDNESILPTEQLQSPES